ncbi:beta-N-acetylhexosaminidase [Psychrobacter sp. I-STPA10]|uniref:beta-N-acetylhexosaminidase n=1 Tax=Psychrobacter sp. I-STPA10 TaxID=2585769 RepID=UPI001E3D3E4C|nr:beta-N-acetylhexosaminidase [Psychrobacter sp. I-STPA10]
MYGVLMIDIEGTQLTAADINLIQQAQVGGVILFARNIESPAQVRELCDEIRYHNADILIGVDQEGGRVARLREGFTPLPAMGKLGALFDHEPIKALKLAHHCGYLMAAEVLAVGIDMSFAPVLDINGISQVIGDRSFHPTPEGVTTLASEFMKGMHKAGMATTGKHFPGHGSIAPDSHVADAIDTRCYKQIEAIDLQPFIQTLPWLNALMPAHVIFSAVDDKPAGFSKIWLQDILRQQLGFTGVIFSDDLSMKAAHVVGDVAQRVTAAIKAGCDMALVCNDRVAANEAAMAAQSLPYPNQERLRAVCGKIPVWQGSLTKTCEQFEYWAQARQAIMDTFFAEDNLPVDNHCDNTITAATKDPTAYK